MKGYSVNTIRNPVIGLLLSGVFNLATACLANAITLERLMMPQLQSTQEDARLSECFEDVKKSGYFFVICNNIEQAWETCDPSFGGEGPIIPIYEDCD